MILIKLAGFVLIAIIFFILFVVVKMLFAARKFKNNFRKAAGGFGFGGQQQQQQQQQQSQQPQSKKVYTKDMGEYVKFEEVADDASQKEEPKKEQYNNVKAESQISDVEFEEIK